MKDVRQNHLLSCFDQDDLQQIVANLDEVDLPARMPLYTAGQTLEYLYFLREGVGSVFTSSRGGDPVEVAVVGREGVVGAAHLLDPKMQTSAIMQISGDGWRIPYETMKRLFDEEAGIRNCVLEYLAGQINLMTQLILCQRQHSLEQRLARWLLLMHDRVNTDTMNLTHEFLALMLGAQRTTITMVAGELQRAGMIEYSRGKLRIRNRAQLERTACECYDVMRNVFPGLQREEALAS